MKGMMNIVRVLLSGTLILQACQSSSFLNRHQSRSALNSEMSAESHESYQERSIRLATSRFTDSSRVDYQVSIYPVDTFSFSPDRGFTGRASGVVIKGKATRLFTSADSSFRTDAADYQGHSAAGSAVEMNAEEDIKIREKEKRFPGTRMMFILLVVFLGLLAYYRFKRS